MLFFPVNSISNVTNLTKLDVVFQGKIREKKCNGNGYTPRVATLPKLPASAAQSDVCPTGDQEAAALIFAGSSNILLWILITKYFLRSFSPFC